MKKAAAYLLMTLTATLFAWSGPARAYTEQQELVDKAAISVEKIAARTDINRYVKKYMREAKGVLVIPSLLKAGFFVGGEGGTGVLLAKGESGQWSYPAFYTLGAASIGIQFGGQVSETMLADPSYRMVILDELNIVLRYDYLPLDEVLETLRSKPEDLHVVVTGRNAKEPLIELADLVTEMTQVKHPFRNGVKAQIGIEF